MLTDERMGVPAVPTKRLSEIRDIIKQITKCIYVWENVAHGPFSWVDDNLNMYIEDRDFCYYLHAGWVPDWSKTGRKQPINTYLREWITEERIATVLKVTEEWKNNE